MEYSNFLDYLVTTIILNVFEGLKQAFCRSSSICSPKLSCILMRQGSWAENVCEVTLIWLKVFEKWFEDVEPNRVWCEKADSDTTFDKTRQKRSVSAIKYRHLWVILCANVALLVEFQHKISFYWIWRPAISQFILV